MQEEQGTLELLLTVLWIAFLNGLYYAVITGMLGGFVWLLLRVVGIDFTEEYETLRSKYRETMLKREEEELPPPPYEEPATQPTPAPPAKAPKRTVVTPAA